MSKISAILTLIVLCLCFPVLEHSLMAEQRIRYERLPEEQRMQSYLIVGSEYSVEDEIFFGRAGLLMEYHISNFFMLSGDAVVVTDDLKRFSINLSADLDLKFGVTGIVPFIGGGIGINMPTSRELSTELLAKATLGVIIDNTIRINAYYTTPINHLSTYNYVGLMLGIKL